MIKLIVFLSLVFPVVQGEHETVLDEYIAIGLSRNLQVQQQHNREEQSDVSLREARGMLLPSFSLEARYSRAGGGRTIEFPVGDLLNPVYSTLNEMLAAQGQPPSFPENLENEEIAFLREKEHETKLRLVQPLFQPALLHNVTIRSLLKEIESVKVSLSQRQLVADIKISYFNYLKARRVLELLFETEKLLLENVRVSQKLFDNDKVTQDVVFRSEAELSLIKQQQADARKNRDLASAYFNFLLHRPLDSTIEVVNIPENHAVFDHDLETTRIHALTAREELHLSKLGARVAKTVKKTESTSFYPNLVGVMDYGYEGENYRFSDDDDYWMASLVLNWNLFKGFQDTNRLKRADLEVKRLGLRDQELREQISLHVQETYDAVHVALETIAATGDRQKSARKSFAIVSRKYEHGIAPQIEYLDARTTKTTAEVGHIIARYDFYSSVAQFERAAALITIPTLNEKVTSSTVTTVSENEEESQ